MPGDEIFAVLEEAVAQVSLRGQRRSVVATKRGNSFVYDYTRQGQPAVRCPSSAARDAAVRATLVIRAEKTLPVADWKEISTLPSSRIIELEIRSTMLNEEPFRLLMVPKGGDNTAPVEAYRATSGRGLFVSPEVLRLLDLECKS